MLVVVVVTGRVHAQMKALDSLKARWELVQHQRDDTAKVDLLNDLSEKYRLYANNVAMAESTARHALHIAERLNFGRGAGDALHRLSLLYFTLSKYDSARAYSLDALSVRTNVRDKVGMGRSLNALGLTHQYQGNYVQASECYFRALPLQEDVRDSIGLAVSFDNLGVCCRMQGNYERASEFHTRALEVDKAIGNRNHAAYAMMGLGAVREAEGLYGEAFTLYTEALQIRQELHHQQGIAISMAALGKLYHKRREPAQALAMQQRALALQDSIRDRNGMAASMVEIGRILLESSLESKRESKSESKRESSSASGSRLSNPCSIDTAYGYAMQALQLAQDIGSKSLLYESLQLCAEVLRAKGQFEEALVYFTSAAAVKDSVFSQQNAQHLAELTAQRELDRKEQALQLLAKDKEVTAAWRNGLILWTMLLAALVLVLVLRARENKRASTEIMRQQRILEEQAREIELMNTELQAVNESLEHKNAQLLDLNDEKNEFLGIATHDLKSPLSGIRSLARVLESDYDHVEAERVRSFAELIRRSADQMFALIKNLLDVNALEQGMRTLHLEEVDVVPLVREVLAHAERHAAEKSIALDCSMPASALAYADVSALEQVVENLISNAIKFSPHGKNVFVRIRVVVDEEKGHFSLGVGHLFDEATNAPMNNDQQSSNQGQMTYPPMTNDQVTHTPLAAAQFIRLEVADEGPGILLTDKPKLFAKFARLAAKPTGDEHSTGLGLSIAKTMTEAMHGRIWCESAPEQGIVGATFVVMLPLSRAEVVQRQFNGASANLRNDKASLDEASLDRGVETA
jgi:signal transduction histidine kinase